MSDVLFYEKPVLLDREVHRTRRVAPSQSFRFAGKVNALYLAGVGSGPRAGNGSGRRFYGRRPGRG